ncbi:DUF748 domain-containing protein [Methylotuvimicrobium alcaliphilum]|uniref:DUF748 domain-containing protein n=1 Tax=Methylotuvimicrobium alcaliphilum (strain DSM 19304 / NCIMB 14124 / VKM B-2133 / 20Z) TaxID=1091494 RepID=G4T2R5_META2|nr:DUF748 domain-containing protein [Methylotuvimicrobium alcaliphilum]CCE22549.1 protein of unknown function [Methylotuvimicrobium alcaliphilum 20Z]
MNTADLFERMHNGLRHLIKPAAILSILLALYALAGFWIVSAVLKNQLPKIIYQETGRESAVEKLAINPFTLEMAIQGFDLKETDGQTFASFKDLYIDIAGFDSITHFKPIIEKITLIEPFVRFAKDSEGIFNFADLTEADPEAQPIEEDTGIFAFRLRGLAVLEGSVLWDDLQQAEPKKETFGSINLSLSELNSVDSEPAPLQFSFISDSSTTLDWQGSITLKPLQSQGSIKLEKVGLTRIGQLFLQEIGDIKVDDGELNLSVDYTLNTEENGITAAIKPIRFGADNLKLKIAAEPGQSSNIEAKSLKFDANYELTMSNDEITLKTTTPNQLSVDNLSLNIPTEPGQRADISVKSVELGTDFTLTTANGELKVNTDTAKLALETFNLKPSKPSADIPELSAHNMTFDAVYTAESNEQGLKLNIEQSRFDLNKLKMAFKPHTELLEAELSRLTIAADVTIAPDMAVQIEKGKIDLNKLQFGANGQDTELINIPAIAASGIKADTAKQRIHIASLTSKDAKLKAWLNPDGQFNYLALFGDESTEKTDPLPTPDSKPWQFVLDSFTIDGYQIAFTDKTQKTPVPITLSELTVGIEHLTDQINQKSPVRLHTNVNETGSINIEGRLAPTPLSADLELKVDAIALKTFQPYLESHVRLDLIEGDFSAQGQALLAIDEQDELDLKFRGDAHIDRLLTRDQVQRRDFVKWRKLDLGSISIDLAANRFIFEDIRFDRPYIRVLIKKDGTTNFSDIVIATETPETEKTEAEPAKPIHYHVGRIEVRRGLSDFADYSLILPFVTQMNNLDGVLSGISSEPGATAELSLQGKVYNLADVSIAGNYQIDSGDSAIELNFKDMPLPLITPYMAQFAGYKIERGQMSLDLKYTIDQGKLNAQNNLFIDQFTLGERVENPDAISLPLNLAIALLKDSKGQINLDLPITGSLDDPEFSVSSLVMRALGNLIRNIATSPFRAIASMFDAEQDLSAITFEPGSTKITEAEKAKLDALAKALKDRLALRLEIKGAAFEALDWPALRSEALNDQLKSMRAKELRAEGRRIRAEYVTLSEDEEQRLLAQLFIEKFPMLADYTFFGRPRLKNPEQGDFYEIARKTLEAALEPDQQRLNDLAVRRAGAIQNYLIAEGGIPGNRIFLLATELNPVRKEPGISATLSLGTR